MIKLYIKQLYSIVFRYLNIFNIETPSIFLCCPGWTQATHLSFGCNKRK